MVHLPGEGVHVNLGAGNATGTAVLLERDRVAVGGVSIPNPGTARESALTGGDLSVSIKDSEGRLLIVFPQPQAGSDATSAQLHTDRLEVRVETSKFRLYPDLVGPMTDGSTALNRIDAHFTNEPRLRFDGQGLTGYSGPVEIYVWEATLEVLEPDGDTTRFQAGREDRKTFAQAGFSEDYVERFVRYAGHVDNLSIASTGSLDFWVLETAIQAGPTSFTMEGAHGRLGLAGRDRPLRDSTVEVEASWVSMNLQPPPRGAAPAHYEVRAQGNFDSVVLDGRPLQIAPRMLDLGPEVAGGLMFASLLTLLGGALYHLKVAPLFPALLRQAARKHGGGHVLRVLRNPVRRNVLRLVQARPGIQPYHVWKELGGGLGAAMRALETLEESGLVRSVKRGKSKHYYENSPRYMGEYANLYALLATRTIGETYQLIQRKGEVTQGDICSELGLAGASVSERLRRMEEAGLVQAERRGRFIYYHLTDVKVPAGYWEAATSTYANPAHAATTGPSSPGMRG